jgi:hypothetical protein
VLAGGVAGGVAAGVDVDSVLVVLGVSLVEGDVLAGGVLAELPPRLSVL